MGGLEAAAQSWPTGPVETGLGSSLQLSPCCPWGPHPAALGSAGAWAGHCTRGHPGISQHSQEQMQV